MSNSFVGSQVGDPLSTVQEHAPTVRTVTAVSLAALLVVGQLYATLPVIGELAGAFHVSTGAAAWAATAFGFAYAVGMLIAGPVSDVVGRRRVAVAGLVAATAATLLVSTSVTFPMLLATRAIQGAAAAFFPPVALAYLTERIAPQRRSVALTAVISAFLAAAIVAPLAAHALAALGGWRTWFYASAGGLAILAAVVWKTLLTDSPKSADTHAVRRVGAQLAEMPKLLGLPRLVGLYLGTLSVMFTFVGVTTLVQFAGPGIAGHHGVLQAVRAATLPACVIAPLAAPLLARFQSSRRLIGALALSGLAVAATAAATGPVTIALTLAALTIGVAVTAPALVETVGQTSPPAQRGAATALYGFTLFLGASLAAPAVTAAAGQPYAITAGGFAVVTGLSVVVVAWSTRHKQVPPRLPSTPDRPSAE